MSALHGPSPAAFEVRTFHVYAPFGRFSVGVVEHVDAPHVLAERHTS
jgi:hypothetical protein